MTAQQLHALRALAAAGGSMSAAAFAEEFVTGTSQLLDALSVREHVTVLDDGHVVLTKAGAALAGSVPAQAASGAKPAAKRRR